MACVNFMFQEEGGGAGASLSVEYGPVDGAAPRY